MTRGLLNRDSDAPPVPAQRPNATSGRLKPPLGRPRSHRPLFDILVSAGGTQYLTAKQGRK